MLITPSHFSHQIILVEPVLISFEMTGLCTSKQWLMAQQTKKSTSVKCWEFLQIYTQPPIADTLGWWTQACHRSKVRVRQKGLSSTLQSADSKCKLINSHIPMLLESPVVCRKTGNIIKMVNPGESIAAPNCAGERDGLWDPACWSSPWPATATPATAACNLLQSAPRETVLLSLSRSLSRSRSLSLSQLTNMHMHTHYTRARSLTHAPTHSHSTVRKIHRIPLASGRGAFTRWFWTIVENFLGVMG